MWLANQEQLSRLMKYLFLNGRYEIVTVQSGGSCMYGAIRWVVDVPAVYTNAHLRRQIVMTVLKFPQFFLPVLREHINAIYGHARLDKEEVASREREGASFQQKIQGSKVARSLQLSLLLGQHVVTRPVGWLNYTPCHLHDVAGNDYSCVWGVTAAREIRHNHALDNINIVVVFFGGNHYVSAGKHWDWYLSCRGRSEIVL